MLRVTSAWEMHSAVRVATAGPGVTLDCLDGMSLSLQSLASGACWSQPALLGQLLLLGKWESSTVLLCRYLKQGAEERDGCTNAGKLLKCLVGIFSEGDMRDSQPLGEQRNRTQVWLPCFHFRITEMMELELTRIIESSS